MSFAVWLPGPMFLLADFCQEGGHLCQEGGLCQEGASVKGGGLSERGVSVKGDKNHRNDI